MRGKSVLAAVAAAVVTLLVAVVAVVVAVITAVAGIPAPAAGCSQIGTISLVALAPGGRPDWWNSDGLGAERDKDAGIIIAVVRARQLPDRAAVISLATSIQETKLVNLGVQEPSGSTGLFMQLRAYYPLAVSSDPVTATQAFLGPKGTVPGLDPSIPGLLDVPNWAQLPLTVAAQATQRSAYPDAYAQWEPLATQLLQAAGSAASSAASTGAPVAVSTSSTYNLGPVQSQTAAVANLLGPMFHIKDIGGYRSGADAQDHATGLALDFMVYADRATGQGLADYVQGHASELSVSYVIWEQHIWNIARASEGWRPMADRGSPTANHLDHVHVSLTGNGAIPTDLPAAANCTTSAGAGLTGLPSNPGSPFKDGAPYPTPLPRANPRSVQGAIAWMQQQRQTGTTGWQNRCLASVGLAYGWSATGVEYAIDAYLTLPAQYRHDGDRNPPVGSLLFWKTSGRAGHVALYVGSGMIATTDIPTVGQIGIVPAEAPEQQWGGTYVGWAPPYFPNAGGVGSHSTWQLSHFI